MTLQTAWLLATLGSKASSRSKIIKREDVLQTLIPKLCNDLVEQKQCNIKYSSHILYGISILYTTKISYYLNDVNYMQLRLQNAQRSLKCVKNAGNLGNGCVNDGLENSTTTFKRKRQAYMEEDPAFLVQLDLMPSLQFDFDFDFDFDFESKLNVNDPAAFLAKRRKVEIAEQDKLDFPLFVNTNYGYDSVVGKGLAFALLGNEPVQEVEKYLDTPLQDFSNGKDDLEVAPHINLEFDEDGHLQEILPNTSGSFSNKDKWEGLDIGDIAPYDDYHIETNQKRNTNNAQLDPDFQMLNSIDTNRASHINDFEVSNVQEQSFKLKVDEVPFITRQDVVENYTHYIPTMIRRKLKASTHTAKDIFEAVDKSSICLKFQQKSLNLNINSIIDDTLSRTIEVQQRTEIMANEASEQARNVEAQEPSEFRRYMYNGGNNEDSDNDSEDINNGLQFDDVLRDREREGEGRLSVSASAGGSGVNAMDSYGGNFGENSFGNDIHLEGVLVMDEEQHDSDVSIRIDEVDYNYSRGSMSSSEVYHNNSINNNMAPRLKHFVQYFINKLREMRTHDSSSNICRLQFLDLAPLPENETKGTNVAPICQGIPKKLATNVFASLLVLANNGIMQIGVDTSKRGTYDLNKPSGINLKMVVP